MVLVPHIIETKNLVLGSIIQKKIWFSLSDPVLGNRLELAINLQLAPSSSLLFSKISIPAPVPHKNRIRFLILVLNMFWFQFQFQKSNAMPIQFSLNGTGISNFNPPNWVPTNTSISCC